MGFSLFNTKQKKEIRKSIKKIKSNTYYTKKTAYDNFLDDPNNFLGKKIGKIIISLILLSAILIIFETIGENAKTFLIELYYLDFFIASVFAIEYFYRLYKSKNGFFFITKPLNIIDLLSFLPFFLENLLSKSIGLNFLGILRLFRVFRIFRIFRHLPMIVGFMKAMKDYKDEYKAIGFLMITIMIVISVFIYYIEGGGTSKFTNIPITLWWALVTMTTVGYGDMYPQTALGKILGSIIIILGPILLALISSITTLVFIETSRIQRQINSKSKKRNIFSICKRCKYKNIKEANYCIKCGEKII